MNDQVISRYTLEDAVADEEMFRVRSNEWHCVTRGVYYKAERTGKADGRTLDQVLVPLLQDVLMEARRICQTKPLDEPLFVKLDHTAVGTVWAMPNEKGGLTIMKPSEY